MATNALADPLVFADLARPRVPVVYLDLNHFICMARVNTGTAPAGYSDLLRAARSATAEGRAVIPLSSEHLYEVSNITDPQQRSDVAGAMEGLTGFQYLLGRPDVALLELEAGFRTLFSEDSEAIPVPLVGPGFARAFGLIDGLHLEDSAGTDLSDRIVDAIRFANPSLDRHLLEGPRDDEIAELRADGYAPEVAQESQRSRLDYELTLVARLNKEPVWRRGRLRDLVTAREVAHEWLHLTQRVCERRARTHRPIVSGTDPALKRLWSSMPHSRVAISMKTRYHRDAGHHWTTNDISDIDALSVAFAYCDAVFTDKAARSALHDSPELRVIPTYLPRRPAEMTQWLDALPSPPGRELLVTSPRLPKPSSSAPKD